MQNQESTDTENIPVLVVPVPVPDNAEQGHDESFNPYDTASNFVPPRKI